MPFYVGNVIGSKRKRCPEFLYHVEQHKNNTLTPNYGINRLFPATDRDAFDSITFGPDVGSSQPAVPNHEIMGDCRKVQFVVSMYGTPPFFPYLYYYDTNFDIAISGGGQLILDGNGDVYCYMQLLIDNYVANTVAELNVAWTVPYLGPNQKYTLIFGVDPTVNLTSLAIYDPNPTSQIPWECWLNGVFPNDYTIYGSLTGSYVLPTSCSTWMPNLNVSMAMDGTSKILGWALFKDTFLNASDVDYWTNQHDWMTDPGCIGSCETKTGDLDTSFNPNITSTQAIAVQDMALQTDNKIIIGGAFTDVSGVFQRNLARLNADGSLDTGFNTGANPGVDGEINVVEIQPDGKILIGGQFNLVRGVAQSRIARLNQDGSLDTTFNNASQGPVGADGTIRTISVQPSGKILVSGTFNNIRGVFKNKFARLNADGTVDTAFNAGTNIGIQNGPDVIRKFHTLPDSKILVSGGFRDIRGVTQRGIAKLLDDGSLDTTFNTGASPGAEELFGDAIVWDFIVQATGKIVCVGTFERLRGVNKRYIGRLNADGSLDTTFYSGSIGFPQAALTVSELFNKKIFVGGRFDAIDGRQLRSFVLLDQNGNAETNYNVGANPGSERIVSSSTFPAWVQESIVQPDCKILICGWISTVRGQVRPHIARLI